METSQKPRCHQCNFYYVTWDQQRPHGCKKWGFKSPLIPSRAVFNASSKDCLLFEKK
ncbi:MAG: uracil-DNA glycosylase [SAR324 cluster bacterium]|uniref:Uracil-DNA glycosylase n=1 Tax=SAR324 cluster bacterium TaxID=2024889 RepID=A0A2A4T5I3_9DELT|nr:MAG: uracil-DNA glycosylase [SAR324 cluster bacterium]